MIKTGDISLSKIKEQLSCICDIQYREISGGFTSVCLVYSTSMCDAEQISEHIIKPLLNHLHRLTSLQAVANGLLQTDHVSETDNLDDLIVRILSGEAALLFPRLDKALCCDVKGYEKRPIDIPQTETVIKGPREGFTEDLKVNLSAIRRKLITPKLKMEQFSLGRDSHTKTILLYVQDRAPDKLVCYVREKILELKRSYVIYTSFLENSLKCKHTPFDTIGYTEKPDIAASKLAEGRVVILMDGNPTAITAPMFFIENFQTPDDYTLSPIMANMGRIFRWVAFFLSTFVPGMYLALVTYHFKLVPNVFLYRLVLFRAGVPVPTVIELLYMIFFFQIIREAGVRLPQPIGPTLSIVGALILGEAAVTSGLASQITVVVVAIASIASYLIPSLLASIFCWNVISIIMAALLGLPGFYMGFIIFAAHLSGLTSCGYPFLYPLGTEKTFRYHDLFIRGELNQVSRAPLAKEEQP